MDLERPHIYIKRPYVNIIRPRMDLIWSHMDLNKPMMAYGIISYESKKPLMDMDKVSYGHISPLPRGPCKVSYGPKSPLPCGPDNV